MSANLPPLPEPVATLCTSLYPTIVIEPGGFSADQMHAYATASTAAQAAELEALRADAETWKALYRRALNAANGLTNYVEDRPELSKIERELVAVEAAARAALKEQTP